MNLTTISVKSAQASSSGIFKDLPRSLVAFVVLFCQLGFGSQREPMKVNFENSATYRWLNKTVLESRVLDDMDRLDGWKSYTAGADAIVDARVVFKPEETANVAKISISRERAHSGDNSLLFRTPVKLEGPGPKNGRSWGRSGIRRYFEGEDWTKFNRISLWIYPELPGFYTTALDCKFYNDGKKKLPALFGQEGETSLVLRNFEWNHVVWEISNLDRDKVTALEISYGLSGNAPGEADSIQFYFDRLDLELVEPDKIEGWDVWPGRISYSHAGYTTGAVKTAIASGPGAKDFNLTDAESGKMILSKPVQTKQTNLGTFQVMDFSEVRTPGNYTLRAGNSSTHPFRIGPDAWESSTWKALNFLYMERCGYEVPGVHGICHRDWSCVHNNMRIMINGGWHDAGDLTQGLGNTGEMVYGLFSLAERLQSRGENPELKDRVMEEARWGLDWILKTSFGDGFRNLGSISSRRTNDVMGDFDDITATAGNKPLDNFIASAAEAIAAGVLKESDPRLAAFSLKMAEADWKSAMEGMANAGTKTTTQIWTGTFDSDNIEFEVAAEGILASVELWKVTGNKKYKEKAAILSKLILHSQQRKRTNWDIPMTGFFYADTARQRMLHFVHRGRQQAHILALTELCKAFPDHADWMKWYASVVLYSDYVKTVAGYTEPYGVLPASIYNDTEYLSAPESRRESFKQQVLKGVPLGKGNYLRLFPVWMDYRGHFGAILPEAQALVNAAQLRGDLASAQLSQHQLEWVIGRNPFSESTMWGEGYDFAPLYTPSSGDMVGALPVGIQTKEANDVPYWPIQNTWTYKEIWVHPVARWLWLMRDLSGPALVEGEAGATVVFKELTTGQEIISEPDRSTMHFRTMLPEGNYTVLSKDEKVVHTFLPCTSYNLDLRPGKALDFEISSSRSGKGELVIKVTARGTGTHSFSIRTDNLSGPFLKKDTVLEPGQARTVEWKAAITEKDVPWVVVVVPDENLTQRKELTGAAWKQ